MVSFDRSAVTVRGKELLNAGADLTFTRIAVGDGAYTSSEDITTRTALKSLKYNYEPSSTERTEDGIEIGALITNYDPTDDSTIVDTTFNMTEVGLYVTNEGTEYLFAMCISYSGERIPAYTGVNKTEVVIDWKIAVTGDATVTFAPGSAAARASDLNAHVIQQALSSDGAHGIRAVKDGDEIKLQVKDGGVWKDAGGGGTTIVPAPVQDTSEAYTYDGTAQSIAWTSAPDLTKVLVTGDSATNAGTYTCTCTLKGNNAVWGDTLDAVPKTFTWTIDKATPTLNVSPTSISFDKDHTSEVVVGVTTNSDGTVSATGYDTDLVTVTGSGTTWRVTPEQVTGETTMTIEVAATSNYLAATQNVGITCTFTAVYGASWDGTSTTAWTRTDQAASFTDPVPYVAGATNYGSPFDNCSPWKDMKKVEDSAAGTLVEIPKFWYKITQSGAGMKIQIADGEMDGFSVSPAHMDRGDGKGERDKIYVGRYHCADSTYKSTTGVKPAANATRSAMRTSIHNLGTTIWQIDFATRFTLWLLYIVEFADWNSQAKIGYGCGNNSATENMGYTDSMPYHTGTTQTSRTTYGLGTQYRYIEGLWDNVYDWLDGCYYDSNGLNIIKNPASFSDSTGGTAVGVPSNGWPSAFEVKSVSGTYTLFIPTAASGSDSTYSCDNWGFAASYPCLFAGGVFSQDLAHGMFYVFCTSATYASASLGCRLLKLP